MPAVSSGKKILLVDDSIVSGTTMSQTVDMVRKAGTKKVVSQLLQPDPDVLCIQFSVFACKYRKREENAFLLMVDQLSCLEDVENTNELTNVTLPTATSCTQSGYMLASVGLPG